jgi:putative sigma-54 modulation protein
MPEKMKGVPIMSFVLKAKNLQISDQTKDYIEKKTSKFERFLPDINEVRVELASEQTRSDKDRFIAEITVRTKRKILRAEERSHEITAAVDVAVDKLNSQIARVKGKRIDRWHAHQSIREDEIPELSDEVLDSLAEEQTRQIVRVKQFSITPMNEEEAIEQMQLLSHNFFVFFNADSGRMNVLYKRDDNNYGLLDPIVA